VTWNTVGLIFDEVDVVAVEAADPHDPLPIADVAVVQDEVV
jgi:hypothetical protein